MLSIGTITTSEYYLHLAGQDGYYQGNGLEPAGKWLGRGAASLGLTGEVQAESFRSLLQGVAPNGRGQVQNAGKPDRQTGWDLTFSADKSISAMWSQADAETRREIEAAHAEAVKAALTYLEENAGFTRRGRAGKTQEKVGLVIATFEHGSSRAGDPQLHTHALVANISSRTDGTLGSILSKPLYQQKLTAGALYRAHLATELGRRLGLEVERQQSVFRLRGVPEALCREFSKRRVQIEREMEARGLHSAAGAAAVTLATRTSKLSYSREALREQWQKIGARYGFREKQVQTLLGKARPQRSDPRPLFEAAIPRLMEGESHFNERSLLRLAAEAAPGLDLTVPDLCAGLKAFLEENSQIVCVGEDRYTTREMLNLEQHLLERADRLQHAKKKGLPPALVVRAARSVEANVSRQQGKPVNLSSEQKTALEHVTQKAGGICLVSGMAGTGKTFFLAAANEAWKKGGQKVIGAALSGKAAQGLQEGSGIQSATITRLLMDLDRHWLDTVGHHLLQLTRAARGKPTWGPPERMTLDQNTVLVIDEAGMVGTQMMNALITAVEKAGAKLVLVGDAAQLQAIEAGGVFHALQKRLGAAQLTTIIRQQDAWARETVSQFARGEVVSALQEYARRGLFHIADSRPEASARLIGDWKAHGVSRPQDCLIFTGSRQERDLLNRLAQEARKKAGKLGVLPFRIAGERFYLGDRVMFTRNAKLYGVQNGMIGTLLSLDPIRNIARIRLDGEGDKKGRIVSLDLNHYKDLELGYAVTTHKGQGVTVQRSFVMAGGTLQDRELTYVQMSRARIETKLYADRASAGADMGELIRQMEHSRQKKMALDGRVAPLSAPAPMAEEQRTAPPVPELAPCLPETLTVKTEARPLAPEPINAPHLLEGQDAVTTTQRPGPKPLPRVRTIRPR